MRRLRRARLALVAGTLTVLSACSDDAADGGGGAGGHVGGQGGGAGGSAPTTPPNGEIAVTLSDGVSLRTWIYLPTGDGPFPLLVVRNPYAGLNVDADLEAYAQFFRDRGVGLVWQAVRGTGGSGGAFVPYVAEVADARDTLAWLAAQPWSNGRFAAGGGSYLGYTAWAAAAADPRVRVVLSDDTAADEEMTRHGGVVDGYLLSWWSYVERERFANDGEMGALSNGLDVASADVAVLGRDLPYWNDLLAAGLATYPEAASLRTLAKGLCTPALHVVEGGTGWRDPIETWQAIDKDGCAAQRDHQWLIVAPESHAYHFSALGYGDTWVTDDMLTMLRAFLLEAEPAPSWPRVRYRTESAGETQSLSAWPPVDTVPSVFFLGSPSPGGEGPLSATPPADAQWTLVSDPAGTDPCVGATDVWFTSTPVADDLVVLGEPQVALSVVTDAADFDLFVTLYDYEAGPEAYSVIGTGSVRARHRNGADTPVPAGVPFDLAVDLTGAAWRVLAGHQLVLSIAPSRCGAVENPNSGEPVDAQTTRVAATIDVGLGAGGARLTLPTPP